MGYFELSFCRIRHMDYIYRALESIWIKVSRSQKISQNFPQNGSRHTGPLVEPKGPPDGAEGCSCSEELEKAHEAGYFSSKIST